MNGFMLVLLGGSLSALLAGIGSSIGCGLVGRAAAGVTIEDPAKFGRLFILQALPGTQGFYGLVGLFLTLQKLIGIDVTKIVLEQGLQVLFACLPVGIVGLVSGIHQGLVCASGCSVVAKRPEEVGKAMIYGVVVETYAILGLVSTVLLLGKITLG
ncbi:MAG: V-type ATP synthase subunit K [Elusimicrobiota bacterium]|nr:V-type ATP synthase subunit K [Elusimicrobiota bacterium]